MTGPVTAGNIGVVNEDGSRPLIGYAERLREANMRSLEGQYVLSFHTRNGVGFDKNVFKCRVRETWEVKLVQREAAGRKTLVVPDCVMQRAWKQRSSERSSLNFTFEPEVLSVFLLDR